MKKIDLKREFGETILERGRNYYEDGSVSNLLKMGEMYTARVSGSHNYKVSVNLKEMDWHCNCPYSGDCKHIVAVILAIQNAKKIRSADDVETNLAKMSKEELVKIMREMLSREPKLNVLLLSKEKQLLKKIEELDVADEEEEFREFYDYFPDNLEDVMNDIKKTGNKTEFLLKLLQKVKEVNENDETEGMAEDEIYCVLEEIEKTKKKLTKPEIKEIDSKTKEILAKKYDSFREMLDENE